MATAQMNTVIQHIRRGVLRQDGAGRTDGELLASFIDEKNEAAFEALVRRHGRMVLGVCRRVVRNHEDAEDAFQATFLVLAHKASSVRPRAMVANWLHGVAYRTALKARAMTAKRQVREKQVMEMPEPHATSQDHWHDLKPLIDQELNGLPESYRLPILLCDLEGKTIKDAAQQLGWPQGTVAGRLARGRKLLANRLTNRGVALSAGLLALVVSKNAASAGVPTSLMMNTVKAATLIAAGQATVGGVIPATVAALMEGLLKAMLLNKLKTASMVLFLVLGLVGFGGRFLEHQNVVGQQVKAVADEKPTKNEPTVCEKKADQDLDVFQGEWTLEWIERDGKKLVDEMGRNLGLPPGTIIKCVCKGKKWSLGPQEPISFEIDSSTSPKTLDLINPLGLNRIAEGIYKIDGNMVIWSFNEKEEGKRPTKFKTTQDSGLCMMAFKKLPNERKPAAIPEKKSADSEQAKGQVDHGKSEPAPSLNDAILGNWQVVDIAHVGKFVPREKLAKAQAVISTRRISIQLPTVNSDKNELVYKLVPDGIDLLPPEEPWVNPLLGAIELKDDTLRIAFDNGSGRGRLRIPEPDKDSTYIVLKKVRSKPNAEK